MGGGGKLKKNFPAPVFFDLTQHSTPLTKGGTLNWSKMVKMVKMVGILGAFLGEKKGEGSWVQS